MKKTIIGILISGIVCFLFVNAASGQEIDSDDGQTRDIIPVFETARAKINKNTRKEVKRKSVKPRIRMYAFASGGLKQSANRVRIKRETLGKNVPINKPNTYNPENPLEPKKSPLTQVRFTKDEFAKAKKLGITLWKFDKRKLGTVIPGGQTSDARSITHPIDDSAVVRVNQDTVFRVGDKIRLSVESPTSGYLYVANCEVYEDGSYGTPMVVFPTKRTRGGVNFLSVGTPIELPSINDQPNYFLLTESKSVKKVVAEALVFVVTKSLITDFEVPADNTELAKNRLELWEKKWTGRTEIWEIDSKESREYTQAEYESGNEILNVGEESKGRSLKSDEPEPHTLYAVKSPSEDGMLFTLILRYE
jgi:hypothetical protein